MLEARAALRFGAMGHEAHDAWPWPDALAATPATHTLLVETAATRVRDAPIAPGESARPEKA